MATTSGGTIEIKELNDEATRAAIDCGYWLRNAPFRGFENYEICADNNGVVANSQEFLMHFEPSNKDSAEEIRIIAIRFEQPATVPVKDGSTVDLIPVHMISGSPSISGIPLEVGKYVRLTEAAPVSPGFYCLLLLSQ